MHVTTATGPRAPASDAQRARRRLQRRAAPAASAAAASQSSCAGVAPSPPASAALPSLAPAPPPASRDGGAAASSRRAALGGGLLAALASLSHGLLAGRAGAAEGPLTPDDARLAKIKSIQLEAAVAFSEQDFAGAEALLTELIELEPENYSWLEGRAQVRVDAKRFDPAISDYNGAIRLLLASGLGGGGSEARLRAGRALAYEGLSKWELALEDYDASLEAARAGGFKADPYILNSRGNVLASLGRWEQARESYLQSAEIFQSSKGFRRGVSTTQRLDGAIYASANAALMRAQVGDDEGALRDAEAVARRAPNSADMRAAVAALLWGMGRQEEAEDAWQDACTRAEGCVRYKDLDFVSRIRRWPPVMVRKLENFLAVRGPDGDGGKKAAA